MADHNGARCRDLVHVRRIHGAERTGGRRTTRRVGNAPGVVVVVYGRAGTVRGNQLALGRVRRGLGELQAAGRSQNGRAGHEKLTHHSPPLSTGLPANASALPVTSRYGRETV